MANANSTRTTTSNSLPAVARPYKAGYDIMRLRAQLRATFSHLQLRDDYSEDENLLDIGFSLIDADRELTRIWDSLDAEGDAA